MSKPHYDTALSVRISKEQAAFLDTFKGTRLRSMSAVVRAIIGAVTRLMAIIDQPDDPSSYHLLIRREDVARTILALEGDTLSPAMRTHLITELRACFAGGGADDLVDMSAALATLEAARLG